MTSNSTSIVTTTDIEPSLNASSTWFRSIYIVILVQYWSTISLNGFVVKKTLVKSLNSSHLYQFVWILSESNDSELSRFEEK